MSVHQFGDIPQIYNMDESRYQMVYPEFYDIYSHKSHAAGFHLDQGQYLDGFDLGITSMQSAQPMQRFMSDPSSLPLGMLHAKFPLNDPYEEHYMQQWPLPDYCRNPSPDRTSISGTSSYATQNDLCSPHAVHVVPHDSSMEYTQMPHTDASFEYSDGAAHLPGASSYDRNCTLRELEYDPQDLEHIIEETETTSLKQEAALEPEHAVVTPETVSDGCREHPDSGIGNSVRDAESVQPVDSTEEPASDSDYSPRPYRAGKRKRSSTSNTGSSRAPKRRSYNRKDSTESSSSPKKPTKRHRGLPTTTGATEGHRHSDDSRPFPCPLAAYSCQATFASKNEWKRHVSTQHIKLGFWRCDLCKPTMDPNDVGAYYYNDFNRKDLFTQHLRRMHAAPPTSSSRTSKQYPVNDDNITEHQTRCYTQLRDAPQQSTCLFCDRTFSGPASWDERMEHVGRHLEKYRKGGIDVSDVAAWNGDETLEQYLIDEGLIVQAKNGWKIGDGKARKASVVESEEDE
jgi:hypothetical protein